MSMKQNEGLVLREGLWRGQAGTAVGKHIVSLEQSEIWRDRPLNDEATLKSLLSGLCMALTSLHEGGGFHGRLSPASVVVDERGRLALNETDAPRRASNLPTSEEADSYGEPSDAPLFGVLPDGYAAFEQYMDEAQWPQGPWTDVHGLSALAYALLVGEAPEDAVTRMTGPQEVEFPAQTQQHCSPGLLAAVARGLSVDARLRQQNVQEFAASLGLLLQEPPVTASGAALDVSTQNSGPPATPLASAAGGGLAWHRPVLVMALLVAGVAVWAAGRGDNQTTAQDTIGAATATAVESVVAPEAPAEAGLGTAARGDSVEFRDTEIAPQLYRPDHNAPAVSVAIRDDVMAATENAIIDSSPLPEGEAGDGMRPVQDGDGDLHATADPAPEPVSAAPETPSPAQVSVSVNVQPWGEVYVNGASRGVSPPLKHLSLAPGSYRIRLQNGELEPVEQMLVVEAGQPAHIQHVFKEGAP